MKKVLIIVIMIGILNGLVSADTYDEKKYDYSNFTELTIEEGLIVHVSKGDQYSVTAKAPHQNFDNLNIRLDGNCLILDVVNTEIEDVDFEVYIVAPEINKVMTHSGAEAHLDLIQASLELHCYSGSKVFGALDLERLTVETNSSAEVILKGRSDDVTIEATSASLVSLTSCEVKRGDIEAHVASKVYISCMEEVDANASVGSYIEIHGDTKLSSTSDSNSQINSLQCEDITLNNHQMTSYHEDLINSILASILDSNENIQEGSDEINQIRQALIKDLNKK